MSGYDITCDPGSLYSRKCYVNTASGAKQEIIGYDGSGNPISKQATTAAGTAWQPSVTVLDQDGNSYQPYGAGGLPFTMSGIAGIFGITPSSGADPQDWKYITESAPGSQSRKMYNQRTCNPLWNTQGCKTIPTGGAGVTTAPESTANAGSQAWYNKFFGFFNSDTENISARVEPTTSYRGLIVPAVAAAALGYIYFGGSEDDQG
tara:strand:- start:484 stop:1098 length:615 start_codon:yes stop_codon:yes gene_type:complete